MDYIQCTKCGKTLDHGKHKCPIADYAVLGEVTADTKLRDCKDCKWFSGINTMTGLGSSWPCESCRVDRWEDKNSED